MCVKSVYGTMENASHLPQMSGAPLKESSRVTAGERERGDERGREEERERRGERKRVRGERGTNSPSWLTASVIDTTVKKC